jgi:hypothetical protein
VGTGWRRRGGKVDGKMSGWKRAERVVGRENNGLFHSRRRESEEGKNRGKRIVMEKLITQ